MYLPKKFQNDNVDEVLEIIQKHPLATLVSIENNHPFISHLPLVAEVDGTKITMIGHLARGNPHWKLMSNQIIYAIFHGPNAYISPNWYEQNDVPTWNYVVVHVQGRRSLIEDKSGILNCLKTLSSFAESKAKDPWQFWVREDLAKEGVIEKSIVGIQIQVDSIQGKFKLNQNRSKADQRGVIDSLRSIGTDNSREVADLMTINWVNSQGKNEK